MKRSSRLRTPANLSASVHQQLTMYALAASTAGVGALGLGQTAEAKVVYTPSNVRFVANAGWFALILITTGSPILG
jgi:hypothetical protein